MEATVILNSIITCPTCGFKKEEVMPTDACQYFYECENCKTLLKPKQGDCCVFCSYGTVKCPPIQQSKSCCARQLFLTQHTCNSHTYNPQPKPLQECCSQISPRQLDWCKPTNFPQLPPHANTVDKN